MITEITTADGHETQQKTPIFGKGQGQACEKDLNLKDCCKNKYSFTLFEDAKFPGFDDKEVQDSLFKWGMQDHCYVKRFTFDQAFQSYQIDQFLLDFFHNNPAIKVLSTGDRWATLGRVAEIRKEETLHSVTSLTFFDRLRKDIVRSNGDIKKCLDEYYDNFLVSDQLRKCLLMREFEEYDTFSAQDRQEFIFHLFKALCLGGRLCQYEDMLDPYLNTTRKIYKDLISVVKDNATEKFKVSSLVYKVTGVESSVSPLFPLDHPQNFCYISIDPLRRNVNLFYHASDAYY